MTDTRELVRAFYEDLWNRHDASRAPELLAEDFAFRGSLGQEHRGRAAFIAYVDCLHAALADYRCEIEETIAEGDRLFARMRFSGTHRGDLLGFAPTGEGVAWAGAAVFTFGGGRIASLWVLGDLQGLLQQLAANAARSAARPGSAGAATAIARIVPLFRVPSVEVTAAWYRDELGFDVDPFPARPPYAFAILRLGAAEIMLRRSNVPPSPSRRGDWDAYVRVQGNVLRELHRRLAARGHVVRGLERMPYGVVELEVRDPDGRHLCFGEDLADAADIPAAGERD